MDDFEFFKKLNMKFSQQQEVAVKAVDGPVLLLAVPGSGKTTVLVTRIGYMSLCKGINPSDILVLTYTVSAAGDMKSRFDSIFGRIKETTPEFRTINGICAKIISYYGRAYSRTPFELLQDEKKIAAILSKIYQDVCKEYPTESDIKAMRTHITYIKNMMLNEKDIEALDDVVEYSLSKIYKAYTDHLLQSRFMDYDDQMVYAYKMLLSKNELLTRFQSLYKYICVDEAQDTSKIQHKIIALLAADNENLFMVGDEDQSIYGFRAAYPQALLDFEKEHLGSKVLLMETNYRSNAKIVQAADKFIKKNTLRHEKNMIPSRPEGRDIKTIEVKSAYAQYSYLAKVAEDCREETVVLFRDNESAIPLVDILERKGIDFRIRSNDYTFFTHRVVNDIRSIINFAYNQRDTECFMQIYYKLNLHLSKQNAAKACEISKKKNIPILDAAQEISGIASYMKGTIRGVKTNLDLLTGENAGKALFRICEPCGYSEYLKRSGISDRKIATLKAIATKAGSPKDFLDRLTYLKDYLNEKDNNNNCKFILSTIHSSKGLEYDNVFMMDVMDGILPGCILEGPKPSRQELPAYEEERRLFYVGITRAKNNLSIFKIEGEQTSFIDQLLGKEPVKKAETNQTVVIETQQAPTMSVTEFLSKVDAGDTVYHKTLGQGTIISADEAFTVIQFGRATKTFATEIIARRRLLNI